MSFAPHPTVRGEEGAERRKHPLARVSQNFLDDASALTPDSDFGITDILDWMFIALSQIII